MSDKTINQLTEDTSPTTDDYVPSWDVGTGTAKKVSLANLNAADYASKAGFLFNFVESGCVWSGDAYASTLNASMTSGFVWIAGKRLTVAAVTARAFTASKDTYIDLSDNGDGTAAFTYTAATNNAASPTLAANSVRLGIIITGVTNIVAAASVNQGQEDRILPIASSISYAVTDSLGNLICPRDPNRKVLGYRRIVADFTTSSAASVQVTGLSVPVIVPTGRKIKITVNLPFITAAGITTIEPSIWDGVVGAGTQLLLGAPTSTAAAANSGFMSSVTTTPAATSKTYNIGILSTAANSITVKGTLAFTEIYVELA